jgi:hypothetical protein
MEHISSAVDSLLQRGFNPTVVFANVRDHVYLWRYPQYRMEEGQTFLRMDNKRELLVEFAPEIPDGVSYLIDRDRFGSFVIKEDLSMSISEIPAGEKSKLLKDLPELTVEKLDEKVRFLVSEVVKVDIDNPTAAVVLQRIAP